MPKCLSWLFKPDCIDVVWYLAEKLSIRRPEYFSNELELEFDQWHLVTLYRILVSAVVLFLGSLKTAYTFSNLSTDAVWMEWLVAGVLSSS